MTEKSKLKNPLNCRCWLMKSEPTNYSIDDLKTEKLAYGMVFAIIKHAIL